MNQNCTKSESLQGKISIFANVCWGGGISGFQSLHGPVEGGVPGPLGWEFPGLAPPGRGPCLCGSRASTCPDTSVSEGVGARIGGKGCLPRLQVYPVLCRTCLSGGKGPCCRLPGEGWEALDLGVGWGEWCFICFWLSWSLFISEIRFKRRAEWKRSVMGLTRCSGLTPCVQNHVRGITLHLASGLLLVWLEGGRLGAGWRRDPERGRGGAPPSTQCCRAAPHRPPTCVNQTGVVGGR